MRVFASTMLMIGAVLSAFTTPFPGQWVFADSVEPGTVEAELDNSGLCNLEDIAVPQPSSTSERPCPADTADTREPGETARARAYLIATSTPGYTMTRQGPERAIERLHPECVNRLAAAIAEARGTGLPSVGIFSAYRPARIRGRRFHRQIPLAPYLRAGRRRHRHRRTRHSKLSALARDRSAARRDL